MDMYQKVNKELEPYCLSYIAVTGPEELTIDGHCSVDDLKNIVRIMEQNKQALQEDNQ